MDLKSKVEHHLASRERHSSQRWHRSRPPAGVGRALPVGTIPRSLGALAFGFARGWVGDKAAALVTLELTHQVPAFNEIFDHAETPVDAQHGVGRGPPFIVVGVWQAT